MQLALERCMIRDWRFDDAASLAKHANNRRVWLGLRDLFPHPYTMDDANEFLRRATTEQPMTNFCIEVAQSAVGGIWYSHWSGRPSTCRRARLLAGRGILGTRHHDGSRPGVRGLLFREISALSDLRRAVREQSRFCARSGKSRLCLGRATQEQRI
jgi:hypothetical protein